MLPPSAPAAAVMADDMEASGFVLSLSVYSHGGQQWVLAVHSFSGACVWDLRWAAGALQAEAGGCVRLCARGHVHAACGGPS